MKKTAHFGIIVGTILACSLFSPYSLLFAEENLDQTLRDIIATNKLQAIEKPVLNPAKVELGRMLFWDKIISGNQNISCATCHLPEAATSDALPLSMGEGGVGAMLDREPPKDATGFPIFVPRNSLDIFNRADFVTMFWDGRVMARRDGEFLAPVGGSPIKQSLDIWTPAGAVLPEGLDSALAAQAMFPPTSDTEMRGNFHENDLGDMKKWEWEQIWNGLINRLLAIEEYTVLFQEAYPDTLMEDISFVHAANALAAFEIDAFTLTDSPFDQYLRGDDQALSEQEKKGAVVFYTKAGCATCHSGSLMTNEIFHNRAVPQIGPGKGPDIPAGGIDGTWDTGRAGVTGWTQYYYSFRTPPLRNVEKTGPWMHDGAFSNLEATVRHELDPITSAKTYNPGFHLKSQYADTFRLAQMNEIIEAAMTKESDISPVVLTDEEFDSLMLFLKSLTSPSIGDLTKLTPTRVPSGLVVKD